MPINVVKDDLIPLEHIRHRFPMASGKKRSLQSILKWVTIGVKGSHRGSVVLLEAQRVGGTWYTTEEAVQRFSDKTTEHSIQALSRGVVRQDPKNSKAHKRATARLKARGMCK